MLPKEKTPKRLNLKDNSVLLYGAQKIGKSSWASQAPKPLFLATEPGLSAIETYQLPITTWDEFVTAVAALKQEKHDFQTVVIDTVDNAYRLCSEAICKKAGLSHESEFGHGKGWALVANEFQRIILKMAQMPIGLIMISHAKEKELDTPTGKLQKSVPVLPPRIMESIAGFVSIILYATVERKGTGKDATWEHVVKTRPRREYEAGDRTGLLPPTLPLKYDEFRKYFKEDKT